MSHDFKYIVRSWLCFDETWQFVLETTDVYSKTIHFDLKNMFWGPFAKDTFREKSSGQDSNFKEILFKSITTAPLEEPMYSMWRSQRHVANRSPHFDP